MTEQDDKASNQTGPEGQGQPSRKDDKAAAVDPRLAAMSALLQVEQEARHAENQRALGYVIANDSRRVLAASQVVFWTFNEFGRVQIRAASHTSEVDANAPAINWMQNLLEWCLLQPWRHKSQVLTPGDVDEARADGWDEYAPAYLIYASLNAPGQGQFGGMLLFSSNPWSEGHMTLAAMLADCYGHAWKALEKPQRLRVVATHVRNYWRRYAVALVLLLLVPVRQYVLAPAEVVALTPRVVAAPIAGVVRSVSVQPSQPVEQGDLLFQMEDVELENRLVVASRALDVAEAEHLKNVQASFDCQDCRARAAELQAVIEREKAQVDWARAQLERSRVRSPAAGVAVFADVNEWLGRPVRVGERVMVVAPVDETRLQIHLPIDDAIAVEPGTEVVFYPNVSPLSSYSGVVTQTSYEAEMTAQQSLAYLLLADFDDDNARLGWRGTAKVYGARAPVIYLILRRPLSWLRRSLGL